MLQDENEKLKAKIEMQVPPARMSIWSITCRLWKTVVEPRVKPSNAPTYTPCSVAISSMARNTASEELSRGDHPSRASLDVL